MAEKFFPFDSVNNDRLYSAEDFANCFALFIGNGIFPNPSSNLQVLSNNTMNLTVKRGSAFINGRMYILDGDTTFRVPTPHNTYRRRDSIVVRLDMVNRNITIKYIQGTPSSNPQAPSTLRSSDNWDLVLAYVDVLPNATQVTQSNITDTRLNKSLCGVVTNTVNTVDTTTLFNQYMDYWNRQKQANESEWQAQMSSQNSTFTESQQNRDNQFNTQKNAMQSWFDSVKNDIAKLKGFDLENFFDLKEYRVRSYKSGSYWYTDYSPKSTPNQYKYRVREHKGSSGNVYFTEIFEYAWTGNVASTVQMIVIEQRKSGNEWIMEVK